MDELEALGYVERRPDPQDRRAKLIVPTERGLDPAQQTAAIPIPPRIRDNVLIALGRTHAEITAALLSALTTSRLAATGHPGADLSARLGKAARR